MPKRRKHSEEPADASGEDRLGALPDAILQVVLSFVPSDETVRTCVLSRRWCHLWKSTPALRIIRNGKTYRSALELNNFVNYLLLLGDRSPLDECEISYSDLLDNEKTHEEHAEIFRFDVMWVCYAVSLCRARVLKVCIRNVSLLMMLGNLALISQFLRRMELTDGTTEKLNNEDVAVAGDEDRFGDLPEDMVQKVLSFMPSRDAVRTCVLATRWRDRWKTVPGLRIGTAERYGSYRSAHALNKFLNYLLVLRDPTAPVHECEITSYEDGDRDEALPYVELWLRYALSCEVQVLLVRVLGDGGHLKLSNVILVSTSLELYRVKFEERSLNILCCEALQLLKMDACVINLEIPFPESIRNLRITDSGFFPWDTCACISALGLDTLELDECWDSFALFSC